MDSSIVKSTSNLIGSLLIQEVKYLYGVRPKVEMLQRELRMMLAYLIAADARPEKNSLSLSHLLFEIRDIAYESEDVLEEYCLEVSHKRRDGIINTIKWISCLLCDAWTLHLVGCNIDALSQRISQARSQLVAYGLQPVRKEGSFNRSDRPGITYFHMIEDNPVGLDNDTTVVIDHLIRGVEEVIGISGMAGLGKSTLAKKVYKQTGVRQHFEKFAWVHVSSHYQPRRVWKSILHSFFPSGVYEGKHIDHINDDSILSSTLSQVLGSYACLVVLDDFWFAETWSSVQPGFWSILSPRSTPRSKILITTRKPIIRKDINVRMFIHEMRILDKKESWQLFQNIVERLQLQAHHEGIYVVLREEEFLIDILLETCNGLPLAIVVLGRLLAKKHRLVWINIARRLWKDFNSSVNAAALQLSYNDLPYFLKSCFLYLAHFRADISVEKLCHLWEAEGLLDLSSESFFPSSSSGVASGSLTSMKNIVRGLLNDLVERGLVQGEEITRGGKLKTCYLQNTVREFCLRQAWHENFLDVTNSELFLFENYYEDGYCRERRNPLIPNAPRIALHGRPLPWQCEKLQSEEMHLRSVMIHTYDADFNYDEIVQSMMRNSPRLRIIDIGCSSMSKFPEEVGELMYLRYLSLHGSSNIEIPSSIGCLRWLLTLDLRVSDLELILPNQLWKILRLRHLYLPSRFVCDDFRPLMLATLVHLETLINLDPRSCRMEDLQMLAKLKCLSLTERYCFEDVKTLKLLLKCPVISPNSLEKQLFLGIEEKLLCENPTILLDSQCDVLDLSFHQLRIEGHISPTTLESFPTLFPSNLAYLVLEMSSITSDPMPFLEKLPMLKCLCLRECLDNGVKRMVCSAQGFPRLTTLMLCLLHHVEEWEVEAGALQTLDELWMDNCPILEGKGVPRELRAPGRAIVSNDYGAFMKSNGAFRR